MAVFISNSLFTSRIQTELGRTSASLSDSFERLSSGLRLNKASDDAAGLFIAETLRADSRVFSQGVRNLNDGISAYNIVAESLGGLNTILTRLGELAEQAGNGVYTSTQRLSIDREAQALREEYNRMVATTSFNGRNLLDGSLGTLTLQAGYGQTGQITGTVGEALTRLAPDGTFQAAGSYSGGSNISHIDLSDVNGDGNMDVVGTVFGDDRVYVALGNGDGSFQARRSFSTGDAPASSEVADVNGDGKADIVSVVGDNRVDVLLGNGDGTFQARVSYAASPTPLDVRVADLDGDGKLDLVHSADAQLAVLLGNGDGTFRARVTYNGSQTLSSLTLADFNGDGKLDAAAASYTASGVVDVFLGNGDGTFQARASFEAGNETFQAEAGDVNADGIPDLVVVSRGDNRMSVLLGTGSGTFGTRVSYATGGAPEDLHLSDMNDDGRLDVVSSATSDGAVDVFLNQGNGTFAPRVSYDTGTTAAGVVAGDVNGDGAADIVVGGATTDGLFLARTASVNTLAPLNLRTRESALSALVTLSDARNRMTLATGQIGAFQKRLEVASESIQSNQLNIEQAASRIRDLDVAEETARLVRLRTLRESQVALLAQANQQPRLILSLLAP